MRRHLTALVALSTIALAGCAAGNGTTSPGTAEAAPAPSSPDPGASIPSLAPSTASTGACRLIDADTAARILGSPITETAPGTTGDLSDGGKGTKLDGCLYRSTAGSLGYDVVKFDGIDSSRLLTMAKAKAAAPLSAGAATGFTSAVPGTFAYTLTLPAGTDSILSGEKGGWFITVSTALKAKAVESSQQACNAAAQALFAQL